MKKALKIMEWNIHGQGGGGTNFPKQTADIILNNDPDIFILVELFNYDSWIENFVNYTKLFNNDAEQCKKDSQNQSPKCISNEYILFLSDNRGKGYNQILIGVKKDLNPLIVGMSSVIPHSWQLLKIPGLDYKHPEFLKVDLLIDGLPLTIIGIRIKTQDKNKDFNIRKKQFICLMQHLHSFNHSAIVSGDFNNARCLGNLNCKFDPKDYEGKEQINYNLNIIKDEFEIIGFRMIDKNEDGFPMPTHKGFFPEDHIFVRGLDTHMWHSYTIPVNELSDHDIMVARCEPIHEEYCEAGENPDDYENSYHCPICDRDIKNREGLSYPPMCDECYQNEK